MREWRVGMVVLGTGLALGCGKNEPTEAGVGRGEAAPTTAQAERSIVALAGAHRASVDERGLTLSRSSAPGRSLARLSTPTLAGAPTRSAEPRRLRSGLFEIERGWATERIEKVGDGLEQSWRFERRPGVASVQIRIPIADAELLGSSKAGLIFKTADQSYLTYSHATWIDAGGERTQVLSRFLRGAIELSVPEAVLAHSSYPAVLDPVIGIENRLTPDQLVAAEDRQGYAGRIALGSSSRLMAWSDGREGVVDGVYFSLVDAGVPNAPFADAAGRRLGYASLTGTSVTPAVAYAGGQYLVAWASYHTLSWARIDETGKVLDGTPKTLTIGTGDLTSASVAASGSAFMVAWIDRNSGNGDLRALRIGSDGLASDAQPIAVVSDAAKQAAPSIRSSATGCWIVFQDDTSGDEDVRLVRLLADGSVVDKPPLTVVGTFADQANPDLALDASGTSGIVVWDDSSTSAVHGAAVSPGPAGSVSVGSPARISIGSGESAPRVTSNGAGFQIAWISAQSGDPAPQVAALASSAPVRADGVSLGAGWSSFIDIARRGSQLEVLWDTSNAKTRSYDIFRSSGTTSNAWGTSYLVSRAATTQLVPKIANDSSRFLIGWENPRVGGKGIEGARVNALGEFEDSTPIPISNTTQDQRLAGVYSNGTDFLAVWHQREIDGKTQRLAWRIMGRLVTDSGQLGTVEEFRKFSGDYDDPVDVWIDYASLPTRYVLTFIDGDVIYNAPIVAGGTRGASKFLFENDSVVGARALRATGAFVYYLNSGYLYRITNTSDILGGKGGAFIELPGAASSFDVTSNDVIALYDSQAGTVKIAAAAWQRTLATGLTYAANPQIARMPGGYLVAWNQEGGIVGARVTQDGEVMDAQPATLSQEPDREHLGDAFTDFADRTVLTYSRPVWVPGVGAERVATRLIDFRFNDGKAGGQSCASGFDCKSGFCVDGVCCNGACGYSNADCQACTKALGASADGICTTLSAGSVCRESAGVCDPAEACDGSSTACPADAYAASSTACGEPASGACDKADHCPGNAADCATEGVQPTGTSCRAARGPCDQPELCDGESSECPADAQYGTEHACRAANGACDEDDFCAGNSDECGADDVKAQGVECRPVSGPCDVAETCDGTTQACPADAFAEAGDVCREASGACDVAETCNGTSASCPADASGGCGGMSAGGGSTSGGSTSGGSINGTGSTGGDAADGGDASIPGSGGTVGSSAAGAPVSSPPTAPTSEQESGCSCYAPGDASSPRAWSAALVLLAALCRRRRSAPGRPGSRGLSNAAVAPRHT